MTHTIFVGDRVPRPLWMVVHVFDPSYRGDGAVCVCGLPVGDDIHAPAAKVRDARALSMSQLRGGA